MFQKSEVRGQRWSQGFISGWRDLSHSFTLLPHSADDHFLLYSLAASSLSKLHLSTISSDSNVSYFQKLSTKLKFNFMYCSASRVYMLNILSLRKLLLFVWFANVLLWWIKQILIVSEPDSLSIIFYHSMFILPTWVHSIKKVNYLALYICIISGTCECTHFMLNLMNFYKDTMRTISQ